MMPRDAYTYEYFELWVYIIINYISVEFIFEEKRLNEISENKFSSKITRYTVYAGRDPVGLARDKTAALSLMELLSLHLLQRIHSP